MTRPVRKVEQHRQERLGLEVEGIPKFLIQRGSDGSTAPTVRDSLDADLLVHVPPLHHVAARVNMACFLYRIRMASLQPGCSWEIAALLLDIAGAVPRAHDLPASGATGWQTGLSSLDI